MGHGDIRRERELLPSAWVGMIFFLFSEVMFFAGLISAYLVLRSGFETWPPAGQPRLPVAMTAFNTFLLLSSGVALGLGLRSAKNVFGSHARLWLRLTWALGAAFFILQGYEWARLLGFGLTSASSLYASTFYLLIGIHALHVLGGLLFLAYVLRKLGRAPRLPRSRLLLELASVYWVFVVLLWPVLYGLVYF